MKIVIPGGSGQVGQVLARAFQNDGHDVAILSRQPAANIVGRAVFGMDEQLGDWTAEFENADVVINLAGKSVNCRYCGPESGRDHAFSRGVHPGRWAGPRRGAASSASLDASGHGDHLFAPL